MPALGLIRAVNANDMAMAEQAQQQMLDEARVASASQTLTGLSSHIRTQFDMMKRHRTNSQSGWNERLLAAVRAFKGEYDATKLREIQAFGGSQIYARIVAMKCRGASALLRDVYMSPDRPWGIKAPDDVDIPPEVMQSIQQLVMAELQGMTMPGPDGQVPPQPDMQQIRDRIQGLLIAARQAARKNAETQAEIAEDKIDEILKRGGFYTAMAEFITDLPLFPFACIKGPVVRIVPKVVWRNGIAVTESRPQLFWNRVSPFDLWWTPGVNAIEDAAIIERTRVTRADLNDLLDLPGWDQEAIRGVLDDYGRGGLDEDWDTTDAERAVRENRENPRLNQSGMISCLEWHGNIQGRMLLDYGMSNEQIPDPMRDYFVQCWLIGRYIIKVQMAPSPRKRHPYFMTSFEKMPGTPVGNALPDILSDLQEACNAALRALCNNMSMASGPQVVINDDRVAPDADGESLYPWKRWHVTSDPLVANAAQKPVDFFQPDDRAQVLLQTYQALSNMADDLSAIPKYLQGSGAGGGAGRTASGLAMLMGNASKILQTVAGNIDRDVMEPLLTSLFDMLMLTDTSGLLTGEEQVQVMGVQVAVQRETQRARQMEFLQVTANPIDIQITGPKGRAAVLRAVSEGLGLPGEEIVPSDEQLAAQQKAAQAAAQAQGIPGHGGMGQQAAAAQGGQAPQGGQVNGQVGPRAAIAGGVH